MADVGTSGRTSFEIYCLAHKKPAVRIPEDIKLFGLGGWAGAVLRDNTGTNIAAKNARYSELTGIYWLLKNLPHHDTHIGVCHYRRFFCREPVGAAKVSQTGGPLITPQHFHRLRKQASCHALEELAGPDVAIGPVPSRFSSVLEQWTIAHGNPQPLLRAFSMAQSRGLFQASSPQAHLQGPLLMTANMSILPTPLWIEIWSAILEMFASLEDEREFQSADSVYQNRVFAFLAERLHSALVYDRAAAGRIKLIHVPVVWIEDGYRSQLQN